MTSNFVIDLTQKDLQGWFQTLVENLSITDGREQFLK